MTYSFAPALLVLLQFNLTYLMSVCAQIKDFFEKVEKEIADATAKVENCKNNLTLREEEVEAAETESKRKEKRKTVRTAEKKLKLAEEKLQKVEAKYIGPARFFYFLGLGCLL